MPVSTFALVRTLHVLAAAVLVGALATLLFLRPTLEGAADARFTAAGLAVMARIETVLLYPASVALLVLGVLMVEGPVARFSFTAPGATFLHLGSTLWMVLVAALALLVTRPRITLLELAEAGTTGGKRARTLWRRWSAGITLAAVTVVGGVAVMAMRLG